MAQLDRHPDGIRMGELSKRLMVTSGNITGLTNETEADGLVERMNDPQSRRAYLVRLPVKGRKCFRAAAKAHEDWMTELFSIFSAKEKEMLFQTFGKHKSFVLTRIQHTSKPVKKSV